ncbi:MAG: hypothetical protein LBU12_00090 [Deltaproteobacteria bacterium]|jgi:hypothetical protein|nr:hypothetical protein [Deltaproteobacteria bacterium]
MTQSAAAHLPPLTTFAIGSAPFTDPDEALNLMARSLDVPTSPQLVRLSPWEDMLLGAVHGLPGLTVDAAARRIVASTEGRELALAEFYERFLAGERDFLALGPESSAGFSAFLRRAAADPSFGPVALKSQVVGPLTFGQAVKDEAGRSLVDDPALLEAVALALGGKAAWEAERLRALGRAPVIFFDEPGLSGFGSAFSTLSRETVVSALGAAVTEARRGGPVLVGCHVCGNTDWGLLTEVGLDVMNFDAYEHLETVCLYPREIKAFLEGGGVLAWGLVPTTSFSDRLDARVLSDLARRGWAALAAKGLDLELVQARTWLTSACGLGGLSPEQAGGILTVLPKVAQELRSDLKNSA